MKNNCKHNKLLIKKIQIQHNVYLQNITFLSTQTYLEYS